MESGIIEILLATLSFAFALWALVVGLAARAVLRKVDDAKITFKDGFTKLESEQREGNKELHEYIRLTEGRLVSLEEWRKHHDNSQ